MKPWQFSIAQILVVMSLAAIVFAAFHWHELAGILATFLCLAIPVVVARTKAAIRSQKELWDELDLPDFVRRRQIVPLVIYSLFVGLVPAMFFFVVGFVIGAIATVELYFAIAPLGRSSAVDRLLDVFGFAPPIVLGCLGAAGWLWPTWPRSTNRDKRLPLGQKRLT